jgi:hypothetical protein
MLTFALEPSGRKSCAYITIFFLKKKRPKENWFDMSTLNLQFTS